MLRMLTAAAIGVGGLLAAPEAHAERICTVSGQYLELHQDNDAGYDIMVERDGYSGRGPRGLARATPSQATYGNVDGYLVPKSGYIDFTINWDDPKTSAHFTGTVGGDGIARGNSDGPEVPINLWKPGPWVSTSAFTCTG